MNTRKLVFSGLEAMEFMGAVGVGGVAFYFGGWTSMICGMVAGGAMMFALSMMKTTQW